MKANDVASSPIFRSGMVAMIALFGIAWMADTFIANNEDAIVQLLGSMAENFPFMIAIAIFAVAALTTSQSAATRTMVPLGLALGIGAGYMIAMWTAVVGVLFLPANGTQIAAAEADTTGTTTLGKRVVDHSFQLPLQVCWIATALAGIVIAWLFFGDTTAASTPTPTTRRLHSSVSVRGAAFLGIGAMVGAGIFALLGEAGAVAGSAVWLSFLLAGIVATLLGYTVVKLGVRYPSSGGLIAYLMAGFGNGRLVGIASWLGYFAAIVIVCSMVAVSFGSYATSLFVGDDAGAGWDNVFTTLVVLAMAGVNLVGSKSVDRAQSLIVIVLLGVFAVFIAVTIVDIDFDLLAFSGYPSFSDHHRERRPHVLRVPRLQRHHVRGRRPARPDSGAAEGDVRRARRDDGPLRADLARRLRNADRRGGDRLRRDRDRRGRASGAGRRGLHDHGRGCVARHSLVGPRDALRLGRLDCDAGRKRPVSAVLRARVAARARRPEC